MEKKDANTDPTSPEDEAPSEGNASSTPGILFSSMTDLRGFRISPTGTAIGLGSPRVPGDADTVPPQQPECTPESFARIREMLVRLDDASPRRAVGTSVGSEGEPVAHAEHNVVAEKPEGSGTRVEPSREVVDAPSSAALSFEPAHVPHPTVNAAAHDNARERRKWGALVAIAAAIALSLVAIGRVTSSLPDHDAPSTTPAAASLSVAASASSSPSPARATAHEARVPAPSAVGQPTPSSARASAAPAPAQSNRRHGSPSAAASIPALGATGAPTPTPAAATKAGPHLEYINDFTSKPSDPSE